MAVRPQPLNVLSLCSGLGGIELGLERVLPSARVVCHVERDLAVARVLVAHMQEGRLPPAPIYADVASFDGRPWRGVVDLVVAGYPVPALVQRRQATAHRRRPLDLAPHCPDRSPGWTPRRLPGERARRRSGRPRPRRTRSGPMRARSGLGLLPRGRSGRPSPPRAALPPRLERPRGTTPRPARRRTGASRLRRPRTRQPGRRTRGGIRSCRAQRRPGRRRPRATDERAAATRRRRASCTRGPA